MPSAYFRALAKAYGLDEDYHYAWVITRDHLAEQERRENSMHKAEDDAVGTAGPGGTTDEMVEKARAEGVTFKLYDDDNILYYTGKILGDMEEEVVCYAPLSDFGEGYAGCTSVRYPGHPEWDC